jgi:hypothetical protein
MQVLFRSDPRHEANEGFSNLPYGTVLSVESQLKLLAFREYADTSRNLLNEIHEYLAFVESNPESAANLQKASERLGKFCIEADSWGFNPLYEVAQGLQFFLMNSGSRLKNKGCRETLNRSFAMLTALLERSESDFRWRLAVGETLGSLISAARTEFNDLQDQW